MNPFSKVATANNPGLYQAGNAPGSISGTPVPSGFIGEVVSFTNRIVAAITTNYVANASALTTLQPGTWLVLGEMGSVAAASLTWVGAGIATNNASNTTGFIHSVTCFVANASVPVQSPLMAAIVRVPAGTTQALYAKAKTLGANTNITVGGNAVRIA